MRAPLNAVLNRIREGEVPASLESFHLDFKQGARSPADTEKSLRDAAVCFANADGGTIVLGIDDDVGGSGAFVGTDADAQQVQRRIYELTQPSILVASDELMIDGVRLLVLVVPRSFELHADLQGRAKRRIGTDCLPMSPQDQALLREERSGVDWSAQVSERPTSDVDDLALTAARRRLRQGGGTTAELADLSDSELLRSLGLVDTRGRLLRAGELLLCDQPSRPWVIYQYRATPGGESKLVERLTGPLILVLDDLIDLALARRNVTPLTLPDGTQIEVADFPPDAIREAVANALLHREYRLDAPVTVEHSPTVFITESPGPLVAGITSENILTHPSKPRNRCLFQAARKLRIAEETGRGVDRMFRELLRSGHDTPSISQEVDRTRVAFVGGAPRTQVVRYIEQLPEAEREDVDTLLVLFTMLTERTINASTAEPILQKSQLEAEAVLQRMSSDAIGVLEATRESARMRQSEYRLRSSTLSSLGSAVAYHRRTIDGIDRKVVAHLEEYGKISNKTLQNVFDVDVYRARDLLRDLQDRGILVKTSKAQRGPGVEYGPGQNFPAGRSISASQSSADGPSASLFD